MAVKPDQGPDEQTQPRTFLLGPLDIDSTCPARSEHPFEGFEVFGSELLVAPKPLQGNVILVLFEVRGRLGSESFPVGSGCDAG